MSSSVSNPTPAKKSAMSFVSVVIGRPVNIKLNSGVVYRGILACIDGSMNVALEQAEEYVDGELRNMYGDTFIRGSNIMYIATQRKKKKAGAAAGGVASSSS